LRKICGISQATFAEVTGINVDSVRAAEIRRRKDGELSEEQLGQITLSIGACLDPKTGDWLFLFGGGNQPAVLYKKDHYEMFRTEMKAEARERAGMTYYLLLRLLYFCESVPNGAFNGWFWRINLLLDQWGAKSLGFILRPNWDDGEMRVRGYRKAFYGLLKGEEEKFAQLIDDFRKEREAQMEQDREFMGRHELQRPVVVVMPKTDTPSPNQKDRVPRGTKEIRGVRREAGQEKARERVQKARHRS
jgi:hypothetical protein